MTVVTASTDLSLAPEEAWQEAEQRAALIRPLALMEQCPRDRVVAAAGDLGLSVRQVYRLIKRCRAADGALTSLLRRKPTGGQGGSRLATGACHFMGGRFCLVLMLVIFAPELICFVMSGPRRSGRYCSCILPFIFGRLTTKEA